MNMGFYREYHGINIDHLEFMIFSGVHHTLLVPHATIAIENGNAQLIFHSDINLPEAIYVYV